MNNFVLELFEKFQNMSVSDIFIELLETNMGNWGWKRQGMKKTLKISGRK